MNAIQAYANQQAYEQTVAQATLDVMDKQPNPYTPEAQMMATPSTSQVNAVHASSAVSHFLFIGGGLLLAFIALGRLTGEVTVSASV